MVYREIVVMVDSSGAVLRPYVTQGSEPSEERHKKKEKVEEKKEQAPPEK